MALVCVLPLTIVGGIAISLFTRSPRRGAGLRSMRRSSRCAALAEEVAFRGYAFQRFIRAVGPAGATLGFAAIYAIIQALMPGANRASFAVSLGVQPCCSRRPICARARYG